MHPTHAPSRGASEEARIYHEGIDLFNAGEWFEAHEVWEDAWNMTSGDRKRFYQGMIQCAVTIEHIRRGNPRGVRAVWKTCQTKFVGLPDNYMGIHIPRLLGQLRKVVQPVLDLPPERFAPSLPRGQVMPIDWQSVPRIEVEIAEE
jgi:predicted metal-dependent hydrolase